MDVLFFALISTAGLLCLAAAFIALVNSKPAQQLLRHLQALLIGAILLAVLVIAMPPNDCLIALTVLASLSAAAYFMHDYRVTKHGKQGGLGSLERKPVLPSGGWRRPNGEGGP